MLGAIYTTILWLTQSIIAVSSIFKWRHYQSEVILVCVRWYLSYSLSYRQVAEKVNERGLDIHHTTVFRWVQEYSPQIEKRCRPHLKFTNDSWRVDETYILVKGKQKYLYRAVDSMGNTLDFLLTAKRNAKAAKRFFRKTLRAIHTSSPRVITVDKNPEIIHSRSKNSLSMSWARNRSALVKES